RLVVLGGGPAGVAAAMTAAERGVRGALVERRLIGGTCLNTGCIPSKAIIRTSRLYAEMRDATRYGAVVPEGIRVDFAGVMARVRRIRTRVTSRASVEYLTAAGVDVIVGEARFTGTDTLTVNGER